MQGHCPDYSVARRYCAREKYDWRHGDLAVVRRDHEGSLRRAGILGVGEYVNLLRWVDHVGARVAVKRGRMVNRTFGRPETQVRERHSAKDFEVNREDMVEERGGRV